MIINTQEDLNAIAGTSEHEQFMATLRGSLFTVHKDEVTQKWVADENNETIERFGLIRADFEPIEPPVLPANETAEEIAASAQAIINKESRAYLNATDWYVVRESETGIAVPAEVAQARAEARATVT